MPPIHVDRTNCICLLKYNIATLTQASVWVAISGATIAIGRTLKTEIKFV